MESEGAGWSRYAWESGFQASSLCGWLHRPALWGRSPPRAAVTVFVLVPGYSVTRCPASLAGERTPHLSAWAGHLSPGHPGSGGRAPRPHIDTHGEKLAGAQHPQQVSCCLLPAPAAKGCFEGCGEGGGGVAVRVGEELGCSLGVEHPWLEGKSVPRFPCLQQV